MSQLDVFQLVIYLVIILLCVKPLGWYMAQIYAGNIWGMQLRNNPLESFIYRICKVDPAQEMDWRQYARAMLIFNFLGWLGMYAILRWQLFLPFNPRSFTNISPDLAFNTAASLITNTGWQAYAGESTLSYTSQVLGLTVQGFLSGATGMALLMAFIRGIVRRETTKVGNFWVDNLRSVLYIFLPLGLIMALIHVAQGVIQNFNHYQVISLLDPFTTTDGQQVSEQIIPMGPVASLVAIRNICSSGTGFFNVGGAHPFENPTMLTNLMGMVSLILIPAALCYTFGYLIKQRSHGWILLTAMLLIYIPCVYFCINVEHAGNPLFAGLNVQETTNYEGKELRIGIANSAIWSVTTATSSNGSVNAMLDSLMPISGFILLLLLHFGTVIFGGVGCGLYGMILLDMITVFIAGMMIGRTPEYLGKRIDPFEMKMIALAVLLLPLFILLFCGLASVTEQGVSAIGNPGAHGLTEMLYAFSSALFTDGSAFAGLAADTTFYNVSLAFCMLIGRYWIAIPILAIAGSMARKRYTSTSFASLRTHTIMYTILLACVAMLMGGLTFFPTLALSPLAEFFSLWGQYVAI